MKLIWSFIIFSLILFSACKTSQKGIAGETISCEGKNPFWTATINSESIVFQILGKEAITYPAVDAVSSKDRTVYVTTSTINGERSILRISLIKEACVVSSVSEQKPYRAEVEKDGVSFIGCAK